MFTELLEAHLSDIEASTVTEFFLWLLVVCLLGSLYFARKGELPRLTMYTPTLLTSLGILGTFVGIVVGLLDFNPKQLDTSITSLLKGLTTAFITSLVGILFSIVFKVLSMLPQFRPPAAEEKVDVGPENILATLNEQTKLLQATRDAIAGSEESSLAGQMNFYARIRKIGVVKSKRPATDFYNYFGINSTNLQK